MKSNRLSTSAFLLGKSKHMPTIFSSDYRQTAQQPEDQAPQAEQSVIAPPQTREPAVDPNPDKHAFISKSSLESPYFPTWCPGCGNFGVWTALKNALVELNIPEEDLVMVYGVGCSGNMADFNRVYGFHALHGRAIPNAVAIKLANHRLKVIVVAGDGDTYGEGLNHLISAMRGNHDITMLVHDNQVYGLTTGQTAPTTDKGTKTKSTPAGAPEVPVNPLGFALTADATFIARGFAGNIKHLTQLIKQAVLHPGFSLVDMFQPCFTFNKVNTYHYFKERVYNLQEQGFTANNKVAAWEKTFEHDKLPIGVFYEDHHSQAFHHSMSQLQPGPLVTQSIERVEMDKILDQYS
jgi:2-oxoglutarate/2-oxoacid ferredoxin oxidoreductase subunit beta